MGPWHRAILGFSGGALTAAALTHWGNQATLWVAIVAGVLFLATLADGWGRPRWVEWRIAHREKGYLKIISGYRTDTRLVIVYRGGKREEMDRAEGGLGGEFKGDATGTWFLPKRRRWWQHR